MTTAIADPRTEMITAAADDVEHIFCDDCWSPGKPMLCGEPDFEGTITDYASGPTCPLCELALLEHRCPGGAR